jgi:hypothetical protein
VIAETAVISLQANPPDEVSIDATSRTLSLGGVVATLQVLLASRRAARNADYAYWSSLTRGL